MNQHPFIFSDEPRYRIRRHLAFWLFWFVFQGFIYSFVSVKYDVTYFIRLPLSFIESFLYLGAHIFLAYSLMYWVIPRFVLRQRYQKALLATILLFTISAILSMLTSATAIHWVRGFFMPAADLEEALPTATSLFLAIMAGFRGALTIGGLAAAIKLMKYWYVKEQRNLQLQKENAESQLQLLKAQVHPHFLFNTLNNIYSHTQEASPVAARLVDGLSGILRFMLYESQQALVPLSAELEMIRNYIRLEQIRYGDSLDLHVNLPEATNGLYITPLVLLPLVENAFKHGASNLLEQAWINLDVAINRNELLVKLMNAKALAPAAPREASGIGIRNVRERLALQYDGLHELVIIDEPEVFIVNLRMELSAVATITSQAGSLTVKFTNHV